MIRCIFAYLRHRLRVVSSFVVFSFLLLSSLFVSQIAFSREQPEEAQLHPGETPHPTLSTTEHGKNQTDESLLRNVRQVTFVGPRSGEGYFSRDGSLLIFQSEREPGNPFYQIYTLDLKTGDTRRVSPGRGKTTCGWVSPDKQHVLFASTHLDPQAQEKQQKELNERAAGEKRRYVWDFDEHYDLFQANLSGNDIKPLAPARGYDAEASWSPDGSLIVFASNRHAFTTALNDEEEKLFKQDASSQVDIYLMNADGTNLRRLTNALGYDGGPFFSADGKKICWRRFGRKTPISPSASRTAVSFSSAPGPTRSAPWETRLPRSGR